MEPDGKILIMLLAMSGAIEEQAQKLETLQRQVDKLTATTKPRKGGKQQ